MTKQPDVAIEFMQAQNRFKQTCEAYQVMLQNGQFEQALVLSRCTMNISIALYNIVSILRGNEEGWRDPE